MFSIKNMTANDTAFAAYLTDKVDWNLAREDFEFMMELEPKGCFVLFSDSEKAGIATTISFDKLGWFGNLIVSGKNRRKGAGSSLVNHAINYLKSKYVKTVGLYAYIQAIPFYERLGFKLDSYFTVMQGKSFPLHPDSHARKGEKADIQAIIDYDHSCLGISRRKMLEPILQYPENKSYVHVENGEIKGYAIAKVYRGMAEVGPLICHPKREDVAINLLKATLNDLDGIEISMCIHEKHATLISNLKANGFAEKFRTARMFHGPTFDNGCIYMAESLERG